MCFSKWQIGVVLVASSVLMGQTTNDDLPARIPIFPLQDVMLFPGVNRPLHIFEPRYRRMVADALEGARIIGMVMLEPGHESEYFGRPPIDPIGCAGVIDNVEELPDGRYSIVLHGLIKFRVEREDPSRAYRLAEVEPIPEILDEDERDALRALRPRLLEMLPGPQPTPPTQEEIPDEVLVNGLAQFFEMEPRERLELLKKSNPLERAEALLEIARRKSSVASGTTPQGDRSWPW